MSPWWQSRTGDPDAARAWLERGLAAVAAARVLVDQGFLPEAVGLAGVAISHGGMAALAHQGYVEPSNLAADFESVLVRSHRLDPHFLEVLREAQQWRLRTETDPNWSPPGEEARTVIVRATSFLRGVEMLVERG